MVVAAIEFGFTPVRAAVRHNDGPDSIIAAYAKGADAKLRRHDRRLAVVFAIIAAAVIAAIVAVALEPAEVQIAAIATPSVQSFDPCGNQTWPHFTAGCIASRSKPTAGGR